ncbi:MAG: hypothetical protein HUU48_03270 [Flavobacteriales bacterium]|nr:hypothetical protein [Flavobacteriales bacterium]
MKKFILTSFCIAGFFTFANAQSTTTPTQANTNTTATQQATRPQITVEELKTWELKLKEGEKIKLHPVRLDVFSPEAKEYVLKNPDKYEILKVEGK